MLVLKLRHLHSGTSFEVQLLYVPYDNGSSRCFEDKGLAFSLGYTATHKPNSVLQILKSSSFADRYHAHKTKETSETRTNDRKSTLPYLVVSPVQVHHLPAPSLLVKAVDVLETRRNVPWKRPKNISAVTCANRRNQSQG